MKAIVQYVFALFLGLLGSRHKLEVTKSASFAEIISEQGAVSDLDGNDDTRQGSLTGGRTV
jgi:hypothetical protein